jgi:hypothetical protein
MFNTGVIDEELLTSIKAYDVGNGGHSFVLDLDGVGRPEILEVDITVGKLNHPLPMVLRPVHDDLNEEQRARYLQRVPQIVNGHDYVAYSRRRFDEPLEETFRTIRWTTWDVQEYRNVAKLLYGDEAFAIVSEVIFYADKGQAGIIHEFAALNFMDSLEMFINLVPSKQPEKDTMINDSNIQPAAALEVVIPTKLAGQDYPDPTPEMLKDPRFEVIWQAIKGWDLERTRGAGYAGATGNDVRRILDALDAVALNTGLVN